MTIEILNQQTALAVPEDKIRAVLRHVMLQELGHEVNLSVAVVNDRRIAELNKAFLDHLGPTDVLAFPLGEEESSEESMAVFGEIVISADRALEEARERKIDPQIELILYAVHGMLHLTGYGDDTSARRREMRRREAEVLGSLSGKGGKKR
ncbi:MAG TPA: rRNA maturation RNase YbeY [Planctomycetota bacterium]|nr:rRNA maturation RNase YbeY [Planctomycetota bacterium]